MLLILLAKMEKLTLAWDLANAFILRTLSSIRLIANLDGALMAITGYSMLIMTTTGVIVLQERMPTNTNQIPAKISLIVELTPLGTTS
jgi:hypothetical protein